MKAVTIYLCVRELYHENDLIGQVCEGCEIHQLIDQFICYRVAVVLL